MSNQNKSWKDNVGNTYTEKSHYKVHVHNPVKGDSYINKEQFNRRKNSN